MRYRRHGKHTLGSLRWGLWLLLGCGLVGMGCGPTTSRVSFAVKSVAPGQDGSFVNRCCNFTVKPKSIFVVLGDVHMRKEAPSQSLQIFGSLAPLIAPSEPEPPAEDIGKNGQFPGLWAINITKGANPHLFPSGQVDAGTWKQVQLRMGPAGQRVRGTSSNPAISGHTLLFEGTATRDKTVCNFRIQASFELGLGRAVTMDIQPDLIYRHTIEIDYSTWLDDVAFQTLCTENTTQTIDISNAQNPQVIEKIKNAIPSSIAITVGAGTAE